MSLDELIEKIRSAIREKQQLVSNNSSVPSTAEGNASLSLYSSMDRNPSSYVNASSINWELHIKNWSDHLSHLVESHDEGSRDVIVIFFYVLIIVVSICGNSLVCQVVFQRSAMRSATNLFIGNLSVSDLLMTILNMPFSVARLLLHNWPFGTFLCSTLPFVQMVSVYVSTFTMTCISLDRYQVIANPFQPRSRSHSAKLKIIVIWCVAIILSIPYPMFNDVIEVFTYRTLHRCQMIYPHPSKEYRMWITVTYLLTQYVIPLSIIGVAYAKIVYLVWFRQVVGTVTESQRVNQSKAKWKTIKMLMLVVVVFSICWMPLNIFHAYHDISGVGSPTKRKSNVFFACHWAAMSSVCYNPFIYCWLNDTFRTVAKSYFRCFQKSTVQRGSPVSPPERTRKKRKRNILFKRGCPWSHRSLTCEATFRTTSSSLKSQESLPSSVYTSSQRSPTRVLTLFPEDNRVLRTGHTNKYPPISYTSIGSKKWTSLEFTLRLQQDKMDKRSKSLEIEKADVIGDVLGTQV